MGTEPHVFELDTEALLNALRRSLESRGIEVIEQVPVGMWWLRTAHDRASTLQHLADCFTAVVDRGLVPVEQEGDQ